MQANKLSRSIRCFSLFAAALITLSACAAPTETQPPTIEATTAPGPTQVVIIDPTPTPVPPTASPTPEPSRRIDVSTVANLTRMAHIDVSEEPVTAAALSPVADQVATLNEQMNVQMWNSQTGVPLSDIGSHDLPGFGLAFSPDGTRLVSGGGFQVKFWDVATGQVLETLSTNATASRLVWSPDGKYVAAVGDTTSRIQIVDSETMKLVDTIETNQVNVLWSVAFSPDGAAIAAAHVEGNVTIVNSVDHTIIAELTGPRGHPIDLDFSPDGLLLISCNSGGNLYAWDTATWTPNIAMTIAGAYPIEYSCVDGAFTSDGSLYFTAGMNGALVAWDPHTGQKVYERNFGSGIWSVSLNQDNSKLAVALDNGQVDILSIGDAPEVVAPPAPTQITDLIVEVPEVPLYPGITATVGIDAWAVPFRCGGRIYRHYDVYYSVDYGGLQKGDKLNSPLNAQIMDFYRAAFAEEEWTGEDIFPPIGAQLDTIFWSDDERAYEPIPGIPAYIGACYTAVILIQTPGADIEVLANIDE